MCLLWLKNSRLSLWADKFDHFVSLFVHGVHLVLSFFDSYICGSVSLSLHPQSWSLFLFFQLFCIFLLAVSSRLVSHTSVSFSVSLYLCVYLSTFMSISLSALYRSVFRVLLLSFLFTFLRIPCSLSACPLSLHFFSVSLALFSSFCWLSKRADCSTPFRTAAH